MKVIHLHSLGMMLNSVLYAYQMANIELKMNVRTNYFFQTISNAYNVTSIKIVS